MGNSRLRSRAEEEKLGARWDREFPNPQFHQESTSAILGELVKSWKIYSTRKINEMLGRKGGLWALDYHDRYIRDADHLANARNYIRNNPVKAGLCNKPEDWQWSSAGIVASQ